jgi:hypothetical protein
VRFASLLLAIFLVVEPIGAEANKPAEPSLGDSVLGQRATQRIDKVIIIRISRWVMRIGLPTPETFETGQPWGDSEVISTDSLLIPQILDAVYGTRNLRTGPCGDYPKLPKQLYVQWGLFFYHRQGDQEREVGRVFLGQDGLCASTGTQLYSADPMGLQTYLMRTFSFMNF